LESDHLEDEKRGGRIIVGK